MILSPHSHEVADETITFRIPDRLKREFQEALDESGDFSGKSKMTPFFLDAIKAYVLQSKKRKEQISIPLEFVSDKSSDKVSVPEKT